MIRERVKELLPVMQAFAEGKPIQYKAIDTERWCDWNYNIGLDCPFSDNVEYRIKPELAEVKPITAEDLKEDKDISHKLRDTVKTVKHYRPFKDCGELIETFQKKCNEETGERIIYPTLYMPCIWIKSKEYGTENLITAFDNNTESLGGSCVFFQDIWLDMKELFDGFTFLDGSPCGVEE